MATASSNIQSMINNLRNARNKYNAAKRNFKSAITEPKEASDAFATRIDEEIKKIDSMINSLETCKTLLDNNDKGWNDEV